MTTTDLLKITLIQSNLFWEDKITNIKQFTNRIFDLTDETDLYILPEMFSTGFSMNSEKLAETMDGFTVTWMKEVAMVKNTAICGSVIITENNEIFNRFLFVEPNGNVQFYNKAHLFRMAEENKYYSAGNERIIIDYKGWKIAPFVCYDLRFPVWLKRTENYDYDLMILVASWPEKRVTHWQVLTQARAIENQCYVVGVNRVGDDGNGLHYSGNSMVIGPLGEVIYEKSDLEEIHSSTLERAYLDEVRKNFPFWMDGDNFLIV